MMVWGSQARGSGLRAGRAGDGEGDVWQCGTRPGWLLPRGRGEWGHAET